MGRQERGFTLLEVLVAIAVFALVSMSARQLLVSVMDGKRAGVGRIERMQQLEYAMLVIEQDFQQIIDRGVRVDDQVTRQSLFVGKGMLNSDQQAIAFTRTHWRNPEYRLPRSQLQKVFYRLKGGNLERMYHYVLDPGPSSEPVSRKLLSNVKALNFQVYVNGAWQDSLSSDEGFPAGVRMEITLNDLGTIERVFILPDTWEAS